MTTERSHGVLRTVNGDWKYPDAVYNQRWLEAVFRNCVEDGNGCLIWQGNRTTNGYGQKWHRDRGNAMVHRKLFELVNRIKLGRWEYACHSCDVKLCCNPDHLWKGTPLDNQVDCISKRRNGEQKVTHCPRGHEYDADNTIWKVAKSGRPARECRECVRVRNYRRYHRDIEKSRARTRAARAARKAKRNEQSATV